ncbi:MAG: DUF4080 domain-containing protein [Kiritimatiellae bacterium]|jgi:radical SAM superfamily enzyme YgiQ (UPF0313 family)|nr:DUF4080 domain-containing protein [Kiritimatiellia bacterium]
MKSEIQQKILAVAINSKFVHTNPALRYIKKYIEENSNLSVTLREYTINNQVRDIIKNIYREKPTTILFSVYIWNREYVLKTVREIKKVLDVDIILGGPEVSFDAESVMAQYPEVDYICSNEGEKTLLSFFANENSLPSGLYYKDDGVILFSGLSQSISNLDVIPFPYDVEELSQKSKIFYYESSRGCPFNCTYCMSSLDKNVRYYSVERVKNDLKIFLDNRVELVKFIDRTYNLQKERYMEIWKFLIDNNNGVTSFHFEISADLFDDETLEFLDTVPPGLFQFEIGVQSSNVQTLNAVNRKTDLSKLKSNVAKINKGIHLHLDLIAGLPYEDYQTFKSSFNFVYSMKPEMIQLGFLKILKGAPIIFEVEAHGYKYQCFPPYEVLENRYISFEDIIRLKNIEQCLDYFYNSQRFVNCTEFIIDNCYAGNAFDFFEDISVYFDGRGFLDISHKVINLYQYLHDFYVHKSFESKDIFVDKLKLDYLLQGKPGSYPDWFLHDYDNDAYNKLLRAKVVNGEYDNLKQAYKQTEVVDFNYDLFSWNKSNKTYLFEYSKNQTSFIEFPKLQC